MINSLKVPTCSILFFLKKTFLRKRNLLSSVCCAIIFIFGACEENAQSSDKLQEAAIPEAPKSLLFSLLEEGPGDTIFWEEKPNGKMDTMIYYQQKEALEISGFIKNGLADSVWKIKDFEKAIVREGNFLNGKKQGIWTTYAELEDSLSILYIEHFFALNQYQKYSADTILLEQGAFKENQKDGYWKFNYHDGIPKEEGPYCLGLKCGWWKFYDTHGILIEESNFVNNEKMGLMKIYIQGTLTESGNVSEGKRVGEWLIYDEDGAVIQKREDAE